MSSLNSHTLTKPQAPIGIFDSGIGGISIARCINQNLPDEQLIYVADSAFAPYGDKTDEEIIARVHFVANLLINQGVKAIVLACNTATVIAIEQLRAKYDLPIIGVEPAIKPAAKQSGTKSIGILVTQATAKNPRFLSLVDNHKQDSQVHIQPCPGLVQQIEQGQHHSNECNEMLNRFISPLVAKGIDTLVLGCTHYPLIEQQISQHLPPQVQLIDTAQPVTNELIRRLSAHHLLAAQAAETAKTAKTAKTSKANKNTKHLIYSSQQVRDSKFQQVDIIKQFWQTDFTFKYL